MCSNEVVFSSFDIFPMPKSHFLMENWKLGESFSPFKFFFLNWISSSFVLVQRSTILKSTNYLIDFRLAQKGRFDPYLFELTVLNQGSLF